MMRNFTRARIKLSDELKKCKNIQRAESLKKPEQELETSIINSTKISALERRNVKLVVEFLFSSSTRF